MACGLVYGAQICYEHFRLKNLPRATAFHSGAAVACGGLLLALAATAHAFTVPTHAPYRLWPIITGVPAFVVALFLTLALSRLPTKRLSH